MHSLSIRDSVRVVLLIFVFLFAGFTPSPCGARSPEVAVPETFRKGETHIGAGIGAGPGLEVWGTLEDHEMVFGWIGWGKVLTGKIGEDHWYEGNVEFWGELFAGTQYDPEWDYLVGLTPFIRYNFTPPGSFVPFVDAGAGPSMTDIDEPDICGGFQFNLRGGIGVHYLVREDRALTLQARLFHFSNAGIRRPNRGVNAIQYTLGFNWFF